MLTPKPPFLTKCSTFVFVLCVYLCSRVSIIHQNKIESGQVTQNQAPNEPNVPLFKVCCICMFVFLYYTKSVPTQDKLHIIRLPTIQMFHLFMCVVYVFMCMCLYNSPKCSNSGPVTQNQAPNEPSVPPLYVCCVFICVCVFI